MFPERIELGSNSRIENLDSIHLVESVQVHPGNCPDIGFRGNARNADRVEFRAAGSFDPVETRGVPLSICLPGVGCRPHSAGCFESKLFSGKIAACYFVGKKVSSGRMGGGEAPEEFPDKGEVSDAGREISRIRIGIHRAQDDFPLAEPTVNQEGLSSFEFEKDIARGRVGKQEGNMTIYPEFIE